MKRLFLIPISVILLAGCCGDRTPKSLYEGEDISSTAKILRDKATKQATLTIDSQLPWRLYAGTSPDSIDYSKPIARGKRGGIFPLEVNDSIRTYFRLVTRRGAGILSESQLPMKGGYNFRDMGGIRTAEGRHVKWGRLFRSDDMGRLTDSDLRYLRYIPIVTVVDFRSPQEVGQLPDRIPAGATLYDYPVAFDESTPRDKITEHMADSIMRAMNAALVGDSVYIARYREFFALLQDGAKVPLMFHCSAGKDRTGMAAALILSALGADHKTIMDDYMMSNFYLQEKYAPLLKEYPALAPMYTVREEYLQTGLDRINELYGSVENFLSGPLDVDIPRFREMYLD